MPKKLTKEEIVQRIKAINPNIEIIGEYINMTTKVLCKCLIDNYEWYVTPSRILNGIGCPKCAGNMKRTTDEYRQELKDKNIQVECLGEYKNANTKILHKCLKHNIEWMSTPQRILDGQGCPKCKSEKLNKLLYTTEEYKNMLYNIRNDVELVGEYLGANKKTLFKCLIHNIEWDVTPAHIGEGIGCPQCKAEKLCNANLKPQKDYIEQLHKANPDIELLDTYIGSHHKYNFKCNICGNTWMAMGCNLIGKKHTGCPVCASSKLEKSIQKFLNDNNITYVQQYRISKCRYKKPLPFDFAIFNANNLLCLIEADGEQHFHTSQFGGIDWDRAKQNFEQQKIRDDIKNKYCQDNKIKLLRIPYWEFDNINQILENELLKGGGNYA